MTFQNFAQPFDLLPIGQAAHIEVNLGHFGVAQTIRYSHFVEFTEQKLEAAVCARHFGGGFSDEASTQGGQVEKKIFFASKVAVKRADADTCGGGNGIDARALKALAGKGVNRAFQDFIALFPADSGKGGEGKFIENNIHSSGVQV